MKNDQIILAIDKNILFFNNYFEGFKYQNEINYEDRILNNINYMKRGLAEENPAFKQPIAYSMIVNPSLKQVFAYQRASHDSNYSEKRLQGKWSWGVGGHIEKIDRENGNPIHASMLRELREEVFINETINPKVLGYINNDTDAIGKVHFGILYIIETNSTIIKPKDSEIDNGKLINIGKLEKICSSPKMNVEEWSNIALKPLKKYFENFE